MTTVMVAQPTSTAQADAHKGPVLEAYNWGLFSSRAAAQAFWLLLFPMAAINLSGWMFSAPKSDDSARLPLPNPVGGRLVRLIGLTLTVELLLAALGVTAGVIGEQCASAGVCKDAPAAPLSWLPDLVSWLPGKVGLPEPFPHRMTVTFLAATLVLVGFWNLCWLTRRRYEKWPLHVSPPRSEKQHPAAHRSAHRLEQPGFWRGDERVLRMALLHTAAALAVFGYLAMQLATPGDLASWVSLLVAGAVLLVAGVVLCLDRVVGLGVHGLGDKDPAGSGNRQLMIGRIGPFGLFLSSLIFFVVTLVRLWTSSIPAASTDGGVRFLPQWAETLSVIILFQLVLLGAVAVVITRNRPKPCDPVSGPFAGGAAPLGAACLAVGVAAVLTAGVVTAAEVLMVTHPTENAQQPETQHQLPTFFTTLDTGALLFFVVLGFALIGVPLVTLVRQASARWDQSLAEFKVDGAEDQTRGLRPVLSALAKTAVGLGTAQTRYSTRRLGITVSLSVATVVEPVISGLLWGSIVGVVVGTVGSLLPPVRDLLSDRTSAGIATTVLGVLVSTLFGLLWAEQRNVDQRRSVGSMWDVATFWPRATHPFSPPCYAERAVPELTERLLWLTEDKAHSVVLVGYSQGSPISVAALLQINGEPRQRIALLTCASVVRRLYGRAFPAYFGPDVISNLRGGSAHVPQWRNVFRSTDYLGSWMVKDTSPPEDSADPSDPNVIDVWARDPAAFHPSSGDNAVPATNAHSDFFPDPTVAAQASWLLKRL